MKKMMNKKKDLKGERDHIGISNSLSNGREIYLKIGSLRMQSTLIYKRKVGRDYADRRDWVASKFKTGLQTKENVFGNQLWRRIKVANKYKQSY